MSKKTAPLTELRDADIRRVDAVKGGANGTRFLIAKGTGGTPALLGPDEVRALVAEPPDEPAGDTYTDALGVVVKAELSSAEENDLPDSAFAYIEPGGTKDAEGKTVPRGKRHFNISDEAHVRNALGRLPQSPFEAKARPKVEAAARRMGLGEPAELAKATVTIPDGMTFDDLRSAISAALRSAGFGDDLWVSDVMADTVVYCTGGLGGRYFSVAWSIDEGGTAAINGSPVEVRQDHRWQPITKESSMTASATTTPAEAAGPDKAALRDARTLLKTARLAKKRAKLEKRALLARANQEVGVAKGTMHNLADAHEAVLDALKHQDDGESDVAKRLQALAGDIAGAMGEHAADEAGEDEMGDVAKAGGLKSVTKWSYAKAKKVAKTSRLAKRAARDELAAEKARRTLAKIGRRNSTADQAHVDAIDDHAAALGATAHQTPSTGRPAEVAKVAAFDEDAALALIQKTTGPIADEVRKAIAGDLTQLREQVEKIAKTPLPGGPRVVLDRDGTFLPASDGQAGLTTDQAALTKAAERFPVGTIQRENLEKAAATLVIKDLMAARANAG